MSRPPNSLKHWFASAIVGVLLPDGTAIAADIPLKAGRLPPVIDWTGAYIGAHAGYGTGHSDASLQDPGASAAGNRYGGLSGGLQAGFNYQMPSGLVLGAEADLTFPSYLPANTVVSYFDTANSSVTQQLDFTGSLRARLGYAAGPWLIYGTGGFAFAAERFLNTTAAGDDKILNVRPGWVAGAGVEYAFAPHWSARLEYLYSSYDKASAQFSSGAQFASTMDLQQLRVGLNRKLDWPGIGTTRPASEITDPESDRWEIHGQTTYLGQGYPSFHSPYSGTNSLSSSAQYKATWSNSLFINTRLWDGGEIYLNPELLQGFGLSDTVGVAGFTSGEAQKSGFPYPHISPSRFFLRQTFGFGGEQEALASSALQLAGKADVSRLTVQAGRFSVIDVFDGNSFSHDPRKDFMNWSMWASGAFDYAADKLGLTYGATAELNQKQWALRAGYFLMDAESNSNNYDTRLGERGEYVAELETRYTLFGQPGKLRTLVFLNSSYAGSYRETLDNPLLGLDITQTRKTRIKYGYALNVEQVLTDDVGLFARWSWNDGKTETMAFTDIDASLSGGLSIKGLKWGRPDDVIGIGGAVNAISKDHRDFLAAGGLGPLVGDGRLNYRTERVLETYYAYALNKSWTTTADYQLIVNPAYNADRGPVSVFSGRLHGEF